MTADQRKKIKQAMDMLQNGTPTQQVYILLRSLMLESDHNPFTHHWEGAD